MDNEFAHYDRRERQPAPTDHIGFSTKTQQSPLQETYHSEKDMILGSPGCKHGKPYQLRVYLKVF